MIWTQLALTGLAATAAGALAVPMGRKFLLGDIRQDWIANELELDRIEEQDNRTVRNKDGSLFRVWRLRGIGYDAKPEREQTALMSARATLLRELGRKGVTIRFFAVKRRRDLGFAADWPCASLTKIGDAEQRTFRSSHRIDWYLVVAARNMAILLEATKTLEDRTGRYGITPVVRSTDPNTPCRLAGFLNFLICGDLRRDLAPVSRSVSGLLPASDLRIGKRSGKIETWTPTRQLQRIISIRQWPESVAGKLFAELLALPGDVEISQICEPWDGDQAKALFGRRHSMASTPVIGNPAEVGETEAIIRMLQTGETVVWHTQAQIVLRADDERELDDLTRKASNVLGRQTGVIYGVETAGAGLVWFNRMPDAARRKIASSTKLLRPLTLLDENIAALWALQQTAVGMMRGPVPYDRPVRYLNTPSGQAYPFQFHVTDKDQALGHYLVIAPSGVGKSTLIMHLLGGLAKYEGVRSYVFDSLQGARYMVEAMGGVYMGYQDMALNCLDVGPDTPESRQRVAAMLRALTAGAEPGEDDDADIDHAVDLAFKVDTPDRTLNAIYDAAFQRRSPLKRALAKFVTDDKGRAGLYSHLFNAPHDALGSLLRQSHLVGLNMDKVLNDETLATPIVMHVAEAIYTAAERGGESFNIFIDEAAALTRNRGFRNLAEKMWREFRKLEACAGMAFQDPSALLRSDMADAIIQNTPTFFFFPNPQVKPADLDPFNLNEEQRAFICSAEEKTGRLVLLVKRDPASGHEESVILDVDLGWTGDALRFYKSGPKANQLLADLKRKWGDEWKNHL